MIKSIVEQQHKHEEDIRKFQDIMINEMKKSKLQNELQEKEQGEMKSEIGEIKKLLIQALNK